MPSLPEHVQHLLNDLDVAKEWIEIHAHQTEQRNLFLDVKRVTAWLDTNNEYTRDREALRIMKVAEEFGEVIQAVIGYTGQNPRKGFTHSREDVVAELADVAITALVAIESMGYDPQATMDKRLAEIVARIET